MTGHDRKEFSFTEAARIVSVSESTLRRKLNESGSKLGATKLKRGWRIPIETLEALDVLPVVTGQEKTSMTGHNMSDLEQEISQLRIENARLRAQNEGLHLLLNEREKVVALLESGHGKRHFLWPWSRKNDSSPTQNTVDE